MNTSKPRLRTCGSGPLSAPKTGRCQVPACAKPVAPPLLFCKQCWQRLPLPARDDVNRARQARDFGTATAAELVAALDRAVAAAEGGAP